MIREIKSSCDERRANAVHYWESRRLGLNLMLIPPGICGWLGYVSTLTDPTADPTVSTFTLALPLVIALVAINILYSAVYCLEFLFIADPEKGFWVKRGRDLTFAAGSLSVFCLAFVGGAKIAAHLLAGSG